MRETIYDEDFTGEVSEEEHPHGCFCHGSLQKFVAFEGSDTGRRFLGCGFMVSCLIMLKFCIFLHYLTEVNRALHL